MNDERQKLDFMQAEEKRTPVVSIIMPAYNTAPYIAEAVESVFAQTFKDYELIIINDGSPDTDDLEHAIAPYRDNENLIYFKCEQNVGSSAARNTGLKIARGRYIALLDSDDVWETDYLNAQTAILDADPTIDVVFSNLTYFGNPLRDGKTFMDLHPLEGEITLARLIADECYVLISSMARLESIKRAGMFDDDLRSSEDYDLWLRVLQNGGRITYHHRSLLRYRQRKDSLSADTCGLICNNLKVFDKLRRAGNLNATERAALEKREKYLRAMLAFNEGKRAFFRGDAETAIAKLIKANATLASRKLALAIQLIRLMPQLLLRAYIWRDRYVYRTSTRF